MVEQFKSKKGKEKITMLTAYDFQTAGILKDTELDALLIGDSLGMVFQGLPGTKGVRIDDMCYHTKAVVKGCPDRFIISDLPFGSYDTARDAVINSRKLLDSGAHAVKLEGNPGGIVNALAAEGIQVMGHLGLLPQTAESYKVQGKKQEEADRIFKEAIELEKAGVFGIVLECIPEQLAGKITLGISIPTIGIGAGKYCDGQILVINDMLGMGNHKYAKFVKQYAGLYDVIRQAVNQYISDVKSSSYPEDSHTYH